MITSFGLKHEVSFNEELKLALILVVILISLSIGGNIYKKIKTKVEIYGVAIF